MKHLTLRQLRVFEAVARHMNFSRAAEELHLSQPAVSTQVKELAEAVGLPLLERVGRKTFLTPAGEEMLHCARAITQRMKDVKQKLGKAAAEFDPAGRSKDFCRQVAAAAVEGDLEIANVERRWRRIAGVDLGLDDTHLEKVELRPSAMRFTPTTRDARASAGNSTVQGAACRLSLSVATVRPQSGEGGSSPNPRNDSVATVNTA